MDRYHAEQAVRYYEEMLRDTPDEQHIRAVEYTRSLLDKTRSDQANEVQVEIEVDDEDEQGEETVEKGQAQ